MYYANCPECHTSHTFNENKHPGGQRCMICAENNKEVFITEWNFDPRTTEELWQDLKEKLLICINCGTMVSNLENPNFTKNIKFCHSCNGMLRNLEEGDIYMYSGIAGKEHLIKKPGEENNMSSQPEIKFGKSLLIRLHDDKTLDEIVAFDHHGNCFFHMEQMDDNLFWMRFTSTKGLPLDEDLVVWMNTTGPKFEVLYEAEPSYKYKDEHYYKTPEADIAEEVNHFIHYFGMKRLLEEMIQNVTNARKFEKEKFPERDNEYLQKLAIDLQTTLTNYQNRYNNEEDE